MQIALYLPGRFVKLRSITISTDHVLLTTKLHMPPLRSKAIRRQRLTAKLNRIPATKLTLIAAPAGFGKTTLIRAWLENNDYPSAWLSLDSQDNSPGRFLLYLIHAVRESHPTFGSQALALLEAAHLPHIPTILTHLTNDLATISGPYLLVLDDYHVINESAIHEALEFLLAHSPANLHLVITSRHQPPLNLARLRGQGQLLELSSADLRFTAAEVEQFLSDVMALELAPADRSALEMRTEGWIAGVQLAALALQSPHWRQTQTTPTAFIAALSGTDRYIGDYLFEEVLQHQPPEVRQFLLETSIVDQLCGELCDAITSQTDSQVMLERLDQLQLFIVPLDNQRQWYRYHHLFLELLRHHLQRTQPDQVAPLHGRASQWFGQHHMLEAAIAHGLEAHDFERAAALLETAFARRDWVHRDMGRLLRWFEALPEGVTAARPNLKLGYAWLLYEIFSDQWARIETQLSQIEMILTTPQAKSTFSPEETQRILANVDLLRANQARASGDPAQVITLCQQALKRLSEDETYMRSGIIAHLASAHESLGNLAQASQIYVESIRLCQAANNVDGLLFAAAHLLAISAARGQLRQAAAVFAQTQTYAAERTGPDMGLVYLGIGEIYQEQNQLEQAKAMLQKGLDLCRPFEAWHAGVTAGVISLARVLAAEDDQATALKTLQDHEMSGLSISQAEQRQLAAARTRLLLSQGKVQAAARWAEQSGLSANDELSYQQEFEYLTLVRVWLAQAAQIGRNVALSSETPEIVAAAQLLTRLHQAALSGGRQGRIIEINLLQALLHDLQDQTDQALQSLAEVLSQAEPEGYVRLFVDEGAPLYRLLTRLLTTPRNPVAPETVQTMLATFPPSVQQSAPAQNLPGANLTQRELKALRLLATELSVAEIAAEMTISPSSVRTYAKRIYSKLGVHSRAEAVYRAKALKLL